MPEALTTTSYDVNNRQLTFGDKTLAYDDNGNLESITDSNGTTLYSWNARNQLVGINGPNVNASFVYDGLGRREKKTINGSLTEFLYDGVNPVQETSGATVLANILTGLGIDEFLTRTDVVAGITSSLLPDALGSVIALGDATGAIQTEYNYEPFGRTTSTGVSSTNPFQYTGRENDTTDLHYYRNRYYQPALQRLIREDPIGFGGGDINLYTYVANSPVNFTDAEGTLAPILGAIGACMANPACGMALGAAAAATGYTLSKVIHVDFRRPPPPPPTDDGGGGNRRRFSACFDALLQCVRDLKCDPARQSLCLDSHAQCVKTNLPVIFPNGTYVPSM